MAIGYSINNFYNAATTYGLARNNAFRINNITGIDSILNSANTELLIFAKDGTIPSRQISTGKVNYKAFTFIVPLEAQYPENASWKVSFYSDSAYVLRELMEKWSVGTYNEHSNSSLLNWTQCDIELSLINYYENNSSLKDKEVDTNNIKYRLVGCFPTNVGQMSYDTTSNGATVTLDLTLAFQYIELEKNPLKKL